MFPVINRQYKKYRQRVGETKFPKNWSWPSMPPNFKNVNLFATSESKALKEIIFYFQYMPPIIKVFGQNFDMLRSPTRSIRLLMNDMKWKFQVRILKIFQCGRSLYIESVTSWSCLICPCFKFALIDSTNQYYFINSQHDIWVIQAGHFVILSI